MWRIFSVIDSYWGKNIWYIAIVVLNDPEEKIKQEK